MNKDVLDRINAIFIACKLIDNNTTVLIEEHNKFEFGYLNKNMSYLKIGRFENRLFITIQREPYLPSIFEFESEDSQEQLEVLEYLHNWI